MFSAALLGEPMVMERYGQVSPVAINASDLTSRLAGPDPNAGNPQGNPNGAVAPGGQPDSQNAAPEEDRTVYDTARRIWRSIRE